MGPTSCAPSYTPDQPGSAVQSAATANYRGYLAHYAVRDARLLLTALHDVGLSDAGDRLASWIAQTFERNYARSLGR
jgi:hypothetical protein